LQPTARCWGLTLLESGRWREREQSCEVDIGPRRNGYCWRAAASA
jgi:hypothetical protein